MKVFPLKRAPLNVASLLLAAAIGAVGSLALGYVGPARAGTAPAGAPESVTVFSTPTLACARTTSSASSPSRMAIAPSRYP
ncbi:hypothetical protein ACO2Q2_13760 [Dyella sp. KRB-257]|uniref:hypothetical protein n=1 Tax=Dyella sp. KRB-257 TaxID=3400915 RepID=UPI003BFF0E37